jgi:adenylate kinase
MKASNYVLSFLGPSGSGKGTQAKKLVEGFGFHYIGTGDLLRQRRKKNDFTGKKVSQYLEEGKLASSLIVASLWDWEMEKVKNISPFPGLIIDGSPRCPFEERLIDSGIDWYNWQDEYRAIYLNIDYKESKERLLAKTGRRRDDDTLSTLDRKWTWFRKQTLPVIEGYRQRGILVEIDGHPPIEEIYQSIIRALKLG